MVNLSAESLSFQDTRLQDPPMRRETWLRTELASGQEVAVTQK